MHLQFIGAAHEVTGSCFLLETNGRRILIDCGMHQGGDFGYEEIFFNPKTIDYVLLTHAHIDHSGNLPLLYKNGFNGAIYATEATSELCEIMLKDSAYIQEQEAEWKNRKKKRAGGGKVEPAYTIADAEGVLALFNNTSYEQPFTLFPGVQVRYFDAGHILGSSSIEVIVTEGENTETIVFSGDIGSTGQPLIHNPTLPTKADYVLIESTYGDRLHENKAFRLETFVQVIQETLDAGGNVVIPSFAVGRTQELLYFLRQIKEEHLVKGHGVFPVYLDSPLAIEATHVFHENSYDYYDEEAIAFIKKGINPLSFPGLHMSITSDDSKAINFDETPKVIISASGMCEAGRIRHHLKHNLWRPESTIIFSGYQAKGTLGRILQDGAEKVKLFGEEIMVQAKLVSLPGMSAHADRDELLTWLSTLEKAPKRIFTVHGEPETVELFAQTIYDIYGYPATAPFTGEQHDLSRDVRTKAGFLPQRSGEKQPGSKAQGLFGELQLVGTELQKLIEKQEGIPNKELRQFTNEIQKLIEKWNK